MGKGKTKIRTKRTIDDDERIKWNKMKNVFGRAAIADTFSAAHWWVCATVCDCICARNPCRRRQWIYSAQQYIDCLIAFLWPIKFFVWKLRTDDVHTQQIASAQIISDSFRVARISFHFIFAFLLLFRLFRWPVIILLALLLLFCFVYLLLLFYYARSMDARSNHSSIVAYNFTVCLRWCDWSSTAADYWCPVCVGMGSHTPYLLTYVFITKLNHFHLIFISSSWCFFIQRLCVLVHCLYRTQWPHREHQFTE